MAITVDSSKANIPNGVQVFSRTASGGGVVKTILAELASALTFANGGAVSSASANTLTLTASSGVTVSANLTVNDSIQVGATAMDALKLGGGTSASPLTTTTADKAFVKFYTSSSGATGDNRLMYLKHTASGTAAGVGCANTLRAYQIITGTGYAGVEGLHGTCQVNASGSITGLGVGLRASLAVASTVAQGTLAGLQVDIQNSASVSATRLSFARFAEMSTGTKAGVFLDLVDVDTSALFVNCTGATTKGLRCFINGTQYWLLVAAATS